SSICSLPASATRPTPGPSAPTSTPAPPAARPPMTPGKCSGCSTFTSARKRRCLVSPGRCARRRNPGRKLPSSSASCSRSAPSPPQVHLALVLRNPGGRPLQVQLGGPGFALVLQLTGGPVLQWPSPSPTFVPFPPKTLTIAPGQSVVLSVAWLASLFADRVEYLYPAAPGEYTLRAKLSTFSWEQGRPASRRVVTLTAGPVKLAVP